MNRRNGGVLFYWETSRKKLYGNTPPPLLPGADTESLKGGNLETSGKREFLEKEQQGKYPEAEMNLELSRERRDQYGWNQERKGNMGDISWDG